jgi:hypothetical protein
MPERIEGMARRLAAVVMSVAICGVIGGAAADAARTAPAAAPAEAEAPPFARVYLALRGCTSCSHCRTAIRQMARAGSGGGEARVSTDAVEVRYMTPRTVPLRSVIRRLADNRLHDLSLVDVLFEAEGVIADAPNGAATFKLRGTSQSFPVTLDPSLRRPSDGSSVRLTALVEGWRGTGDLRLIAREVKAGA